MNPFGLPSSSVVERNIPKNAFDSYASAAQRRVFTEKVAKITWQNKLSTSTINLPSKEVMEIQFIEVQLKEKCRISSVLEVMEKAMPYAVIFWVTFGEEAYLSTAQKHLNPLNEDNAVIDWTFSSDWFKRGDCPYTLPLNQSLDAVHLRLCAQLADRPLSSKLTFSQLVEEQSRISALEREIKHLKSAIRKEIQFNRKVELNVQLQQKESELEQVLDTIR
jgi:hypothetical protein